MRLGLYTDMGSFSVSYGWMGWGGWMGVGGGGVTRSKARLDSVLTWGHSQ